jgi:hypothetical protein
LHDGKILKIRGRRSSFNIRKVMWLIGELKPALEHIDAGGIHVLNRPASQKDVDGRDTGERKRRRPSNGYARP